MVTAAAAANAIAVDEISPAKVAAPVFKVKAVFAVTSPSKLRV
jgi:hypothetical protein